jgi:hypothetical protein
MEILTNLLFSAVISNARACLSTSVVGSTPGKSTKNVGALLSVSAKTSSILNGGDSIYLSPAVSLTNIAKAEVTLSGLKALNNNKLIVSSLLTLRIMLRAETLSNDEFDHLVIGKVDPQPKPMPECLKSFLND